MKELLFPPNTKYEIACLATIVSITLLSIIMMPVDGDGSIFFNFPFGIAVNPNNNLVYVAHTYSYTVSVIDSTTNEVLTNNITVGVAPFGVAVNPSNNLVYVTNDGSDTVSVINSTTNEVLTNNITVQQPTT